MTMPLLIHWESIAEQPALWRSLISRLQAEAPPASPQHAHQPLWLVGEGSSYNVLQWVGEQVGLLDSWQGGVKVYRPREAEQALFQHQKLGLFTPETTPFVVAVTQSGKTRTLHEALEFFSNTLPNAVQGVLLTNHPAPDTLDCVLPQRWSLQAGSEPCVAALKTVTGFYQVLESWFSHWLKQHHRPVGKTVDWLTLATHTEAWLTHWQSPTAFEVPLRLLAEHRPYQPWILLGAPLVQALLAEVQLKLLETTHHSVAYFEGETFKHGYKALLTPVEAQLRPVLLYYLTPCEHQSKALVADAQSHQVPATHPAIDSLWVGDSQQLQVFTTGYALPSTARVCGIEGLAGTSSQLGLLVWTQCLAYHLNKALNVEVTTLTKFIG